MTFSTLELLNHTSKYLYGKHYIELQRHEEIAMSKRMDRVFKKHKGETVTLKQWRGYLSHDEARGY
jgi:hypothetical protein